MLLCLLYCQKCVNVIVFISSVFLPQGSVKIEPKFEPVYSQVLEVSATHAPRSATPQAENYSIPPRPQSPTPERGMSIEVPAPELKYEAANSHPSSSPSAIMSPPPVMPDNSAAPKPIPVNINAGGSEPRTPHHHNYCHRDHPRRRHRQHQLEQQQREEEERRQQAVQQQQQIFRPKSSAQNLEILSEAIRQIEGDGVLCQMESDHLMGEMYVKRQPIPTMEEADRETVAERMSSSVPDAEMRSESSGRDSPLHHHPLHHRVKLDQTQQSQPQLHQQSVGTITTSPAIPPTTSFSDKYPMATHLLHQPVHRPYFNRPGVIVHKQ